MKIIISKSSNTIIKQEIPVSVKQHITCCRAWKRRIQINPREYKEEFLEILESLENEEFVETPSFSHDIEVKNKIYKIYVGV